MYEENYPNGVEALEEELETSIRVRYQETDRMGVVYYANYLTWFEIGRTEYFRELGFPYSSLEKEGIFLPVVKSYCEYKSPAYYDDLIKLKTSVKKFTPVKLIFWYNVYRKSPRKLLATGETVHAFVDEEGKPVNMKKKKNALFDGLARQL